MEYRIVILEEGIIKTIQSRYMRKDSTYLYLKCGRYPFSKILYMEKIQSKSLDNGNKEEKTL
jgi:hypothetical protein